MVPRPPANPCDRSAFERLKRILPARAAGQAGSATRACVLPVPDEIALKLTNRCNLRCTHCYQWSAHGHHHDLAAAEQQRDLDFAIVERLFADTAARRSSIYLWGGEPLAYRDFPALCALLRRDPRWVVICTNGMLIEQHLEHLLPISAQLEMYVAVDGPPAVHDALRGRGAHARVEQGLRQLVLQRAAGAYRGEISINCVVTDRLIPDLFDCVAHWQDNGIDTFHISLPWFLSGVSAEQMDAYCSAHLPWTLTGDGRRSWHAYAHGLSVGSMTSLLAQFDRINAHPWRIKVRYNPEPDRAELADFLAGGSRPVQKRTRCLALNSRLDVFPNGDVVTCKFFPEFVAGSLRTQSLAAIWHGARFEAVRDTVQRCGLMPVCAKCNLLYTRGI